MFITHTSLEYILYILQTDPVIGHEAVLGGYNSIKFSFFPDHYGEVLLNTHVNVSPLLFPL